MSDEKPSVNKDTEAIAVPTDNPTDYKQVAALPGDRHDTAGTPHEPTQDKNDRPYGYANAVLGVVAALINAFLVVVLIFQTLAVREQLDLSRDVLESSNESFRRTIVEMREQGDAMTAQVESIRTLTHTLEQLFRDQQRARMSFRVELEEIDDVQTGVRIVSPFDIGGTTEARQVHFKNYVSVGAPGQRQYLDSLKLDWNQRESHPITDVDPTEVGRQFVSRRVLSQTRWRTAVSKKKSLYFVGRLEYCDVYGACRYFMRCAELGHQPGVISYCGTRVGDLDSDRSSSALRKVR